MIAMSGCSEVDIEVSDTDMETMESDNYREVLRDNKDANNVLTIIQEEAGFFYKDRWKFINLSIQSISRLCWISQLYSRVKEQEESSRVI